MCSIKPEKVAPIDGETVFRFAFKRNKRHIFKVLGLFDPTGRNGRPGSGIGCLTIVAVKDEDGKIWSGVTAFRNKKEQEPFMRCGINVARKRLLRKIEKNEDGFTSPTLFNGIDETPVQVLASLPDLVLEVLEQRRPSILFSATT